MDVGFNKCFEWINAMAAYKWFKILIHHTQFNFFFNSKFEWFIFPHDRIHLRYNWKKWRMKTLLYYSNSSMFCFPCKASPSSHHPPAAAACCCVAGCPFFSGWRSDAQAGQEEGTHFDPEDQPRYRHGWWHSHLESARPNAQRDKAFYCPSAPKEERRGEESEFTPLYKHKSKIGISQNMHECKFKAQSLPTN